jgi:hypothetical protein
MTIKKWKFLAIPKLQNYCNAHIEDHGNIQCPKAINYSAASGLALEVKNGKPSSVLKIAINTSPLTGLI